MSTQKIVSHILKTYPSSQIINELYFMGWSSRIYRRVGWKKFLSYLWKSDLETLLRNLSSRRGLDA